MRGAFTSRLQLLVVAVVMMATATAAADPVPLIIDTDMCSDVDDVGAVCIAHALEQQGLARLAAVVHNDGLFEGVGAVSVLNHWYGRDDIPVGAFKGQFGHNATSRYVPDLVANFPSPVKNYSQVPDALDVYRSVLAAQPDHSVAISSIGFLTNLAALLKSGPDAHSPLTGVELVAQKVKRVAIMGGAYPATAPGSKQGEFNLGCGNGLDGPALECAGTAKYVVDKLPAGVELIFSGFEVGVRIETGAVLTTCAPAANPCRQAYIDFLGGPNRNRMSWDPATTLFAVTGDPGSIGCSTAGQGGHNNVTAVGTNSWQAGQQPAGRAESYLVLEGVQGVAKAAKAIDDLLCVAPK